MVNILQKRVAALNIFDINMPKDTQEEWACENDDDQLKHPVELDDQESMQNWVREKVSVIPISDVVFQFFRIVLINNLLELFNVEQLFQPW